MSPQQSIGHYRIVSKLGEGGMGAVYRATDTKLNRDVAIKVLPDSFAADPDRLARFTREAQVLAGLNHPNIAQIYGVEQGAIVMELVEGEAPKGPLTTGEFLPIVEQFIDALEYAHDRGIVHRDLKPANLKLTPDGRLKVLDFGLAKALAPDTAAAQAGDASVSPTLTMSATMAGVIMGTAAYMSPEQARGQLVDKRADIWSFGVVVHELLTGRSLFDGGTVSDTLAAVLRQDLDLNDVPRRFRRLLVKCLTRDPRQRLRDITGARLLLEEAVAEPAPAQAPAIHHRWRWPAVAGALLLSTAFLSIIHFREAPPPAPVVRSSIVQPDNALLDSTSMALSADGRRLAFAARSSDGKTQLWIRSLDSLRPQPLAGTDGATFPFWSPDGKSIGFFANSKLNRMDLAGGLILVLAGAPPSDVARGAAWSPAGVILFAGSRGPLKKISASGGQVSDASKIASGETSHRFPCFLPDGSHYLFLAGESNSTARRRVRLGALNSLESKPLMESDSGAIYSAGYLLFMLANTLMAQPFETKLLALSGEPRPVAEGVALVPVPGKGGFSASIHGTLIYGHAEDRELQWLDREGRSLGKLGEKGYFETLSFSAEHKSLAVTGGNDNRESSVWLVDLAKGTRQRLTTGPSDQDVVLSPDGATVFYTAHRNGHDAIYRKTVHGSGAEELLVGDERLQRVSSISPDNKNLLLRWYSEDKTGLSILRDPLGPPGAKPSDFLTSPFHQSYGEFSPDGKWVAFESSETGRPEIYVVSFPGGGDRRRISTAGGFGARWRGDGGEIFYLRPDFMLMTVEVADRHGKIETGAARELFRLPPRVNAGRTWGISADGQRILTIMPAQEAAPSLTLVQNWVSGSTN